MELAHRFRELRAQAGLTGRELAGAKFDPSYISQIESGRRQPSSDALQFFADRLGVSTKYLATGIPDGTEGRLQYQLEDARGRLREGQAATAEQLLEKLLAQVQEFQLPRLQGLALVALGDAQRQLGRPRDAAHSYEDAMEAGLGRHDRGVAVGGLARALISVGDLAYAAEVIDDYMGATEGGPADPALLADLHSVLVTVFFERGQIMRAERAARRALAAAGPDVPNATRAVAYWHASRVLADRKEWDEALEMATRARILMEAAEDRRRVARLHNAYAFLCLEAEPPRLEEARQHLDTAEAMQTDGWAPDDRVQLLTERSRLALMEERPQEALEFAERALEEWGSDRLEFGRCLFLKGRSLSSLGRAREARAALREAAERFQLHGARQQEANCWRELGELDLAEGDVDGAISSLRSGLVALDPRRSRA